MEDTKELFKPYYEDYIKDLDGLLRIPSVLDEYNKDNIEAPFGVEIRNALDYMLKLGERDGFTTVNVDNYSGFLEFGEGDKVLLIMCHLDCVPITGIWDNPPFEPVIKDDYIYARGAIDDKGPLMSAYYSLKILRDSGFNPNMKVRFFFGCDEESGSRGLLKYIEKYGECDFGFSPDANFPCIYAEKGISGVMFSGVLNDDRVISFNSGTVSNVVPDVARCKLNIDLETEYRIYLNSKGLKGEFKDGEYIMYGKASHGSIPEDGENAALMLIHFLNKYIKNSFFNFVDEYLYEDYFGEKLKIAHVDPEMGKVSNCASIYNLENNEFKIICNIRYPKGFDFDSNMETLKNLASSYFMDFKVLSNSPLHYCPKDSHLIESLIKAFDKWADPKYSREPISIGGGTYARDFKNAVAFGPMFMDEIETMHMPNECASIDNLIKSIYIYMDAVKNICD